MNKDTIFSVKNRSYGIVVYSIKEDGIRREFHPGETKEISFGELEKLSFQSGGRELIERYLQITNKEVTDTLNITTEPEYYLTEDEIKNLILNGSLDAFLDCLDFAPIGVLDLIKKMAVTLPCNDIAKRRAIKDKLGFDVNKAIVHIEEEQDNDEAEAQVVTTRRVKVEEPKSERRSVPNYKVVSEQ